jgi:hypothetical protein
MVREDDRWGVSDPHDLRTRDGTLRGIQFLARAEARAKNKHKRSQIFSIIKMIADNAAILGWTGTLATFSLGQWNEAIACVCGVATTIYMVTKLIKTLKEKDK